ncbi:hypothetical protein ACQPZJ_18355 [Actinoplanes sp. CA-054009]
MADRTELHQALLRLAGLLPDADLARARLALAGGELVQAPAASLPGARYTFAPSLTEGPIFGTPGAPMLDLTGPGAEQDFADQDAVRAASAIPGAVALWRSWRLPLVGADHAGPARVFVLAVEGDLAGATAALTREVGETGVTVETYHSGEEPPPYARSARASGALLWTAEPAGPVRLARVYDTERGFDPAHERLDGDDRARVLAWLEAGTTVLATTARDTDVLEPERGEVVPIDFRSDGHWIWTDTTAYYLREYGLAPEPELLAHVRAAGDRVPFTDPVGEHRALAALFQSPAFAS